MITPQCNPDILGMWDIEKSNYNGVFIAPKMYALQKGNKEYIKAKGIPSYMVIDPKYDDEKAKEAKH